MSSELVSQPAVSAASNGSKRKRNMKSCISCGLVHYAKTGCRRGRVNPVIQSRSASAAPSSAPSSSSSSSDNASSSRVLQMEDLVAAQNLYESDHEDDEDVVEKVIEQAEEEKDDIEGDAVGVAENQPNVNNQEEKSADVVPSYETINADGSITLSKDGLQITWTEAQQPIEEDERYNERRPFKPSISFTRAATDLNGSLKRIDASPSNIHSNRIKQLWINYFLIFFPMATIPGTIAATNANLAAKGKGEIKMDCPQFFTLLGLFLAMSLQKRHASYRDFWANHKQDENHISDGPNFGKYMPLRRFEMFISNLQLIEYTEQQLNSNRWIPIDGFVDEFNKRVSSFFKPGDMVTVDESMIKWTGQGGWSNKGMPHVTKIPRKPTPVGCEVKNVACADTRIMFHLVLQKGKEANRINLGRHWDETKSVGASQVLQAAEEDDFPEVVQEVPVVGDPVDGHLVDRGQGKHVRLRQPPPVNQVVDVGTK